jgi:hypothetical protein
VASWIFNISRGCAKYYYYAVANSLVLPSAGQFTSAADNALLMVAINAGATTDDVLADYDDLASLLAGTPDEVTNVGYARKAITDSTLVATPTPDDTFNRYDLDIPDQSWTGVAAGSAWTDVLVCFRPTSVSPDSDVIPISCHDTPYTPNGNDIVASIAATGFYRSSG